MTEEKPMGALHLGDGAYVSIGRYRGELVITANHHDPDIATDRVFLDRVAMTALTAYIKRYQEWLDNE